MCSNGLDLLVLTVELWTLTSVHQVLKSVVPSEEKRKQEEEDNQDQTHGSNTWKDRHALWTMELSYLLLKELTLIYESIDHIRIQLQNYSLIMSSEHSSISYFCFIFFTPPLPNIFLYFSPNSSKYFSLPFKPSKRVRISSDTFSFFSSFYSIFLSKLRDRIELVFFCAFSMAWSDYLTINISILDDFFLLKTYL